MRKLKNVNLIVKNKSIFLEDVEVDKIFISNKVSTREGNCKYFTNYKESYKITPMCIILPKIRGRTRKFDKTVCISFSQKILKSYRNTIKCGIKSAIVLKKNLIGNLLKAKKI